MRAQRRGLTEEQRSELWQRWRAGQTLLEIGAALGKHHASVFAWVRANGGFSPPNRKRRAGTLTVEEREEISRGIADEQSFRQIAARLQRPVSTISREVARHGGRAKYRAIEAETAALARARRPKVCKLATNVRLQRCVAFKLMSNWSPEQISAWLKLRYPEDDRMRISHETIYRSLFIQARGVLKKELQEHLRTRRKMRRSKLSSTKGQKRGQIVDAVPISERPPEIEDRAVPGHWEGDLISGSRNSHIATLVERHSRYVMLVKVAAKDTNTVVAALKKQVVKLPDELRKSLTWDRGTELAAHKDFTVSTDVAVYFCDPHSPWQRGSNENTNRLLRFWFEKGSDLSRHTKADLKRIQDTLNRRPRPTLNLDTPAERLAALLNQAA
jgi:IS30 family transposase